MVTDEDDSPNSTIGDVEAGPKQDPEDGESPFQVLGANVSFNTDKGGLVEFVSRWPDQDIAGWQAIVEMQYTPPAGGLAEGDSDSFWFRGRDVAAGPGDENPFYSHVPGKAPSKVTIVTDQLPALTPATPVGPVIENGQYQFAIDAVDPDANDTIVLIEWFVDGDATPVKSVDYTDVNDFPNGPQNQRHAQRHPRRLDATGRKNPR